MTANRLATRDPEVTVNAMVPVLAMDDYTTQAKAYWWTTAIVGATAPGLALVRVGQLEAAVVLQIPGGSAIAALTGLFALALAYFACSTLLMASPISAKKGEPIDAWSHLHGNGWIALARALGKRVVVEGIETSQQLERLVGLDCDRGQGYLLARPAPPDVVAELLERDAHYPERLTGTISEAPAREAAPAVPHTSGSSQTPSLQVFLAPPSIPAGSPLCDTRRGRRTHR